MKKLELKGKVFGWLAVLNQYPTRSNDGKVQWVCLCVCGRKTIVSGPALKSGNTTSCGCYPWKHHLSKTSEYKTWDGMCRRCLSPQDPHYDRYGGRGIKVCKRWLIFKNFREDMGKRPSLRHSLDRINNDKGYYPKNCRWALPEVQNTNRCNTVYLTLDGTTLPLTEWGRRLNIKTGTLESRRNRGWTDKEILTTPIRDY